MGTRGTLLALGLFGPLALVGSVGEAQTVVVVECAKGKSLQEAIDKNAGKGPVVFEIQGICEENVRIGHSDVTLRGADPELDGIRGVAEDPLPDAAVEIFYAHETRFESLSVQGASDGPILGIGLWFSSLWMEDCNITNNASVGIHASATSYVNARGLLVSGNYHGVRAQRGAVVICWECTVEGNTRWAGLASDGGTLSFTASTVSGSRGLSSSGAESYADVDCVNTQSTHDCSLVATTWAGFSFGGTVALLGVDFQGALSASEKGHVALTGARQLDDVTNSVDLYATLTVDDPFPEYWGASTLGTTHASHFSRVILGADTLLTGAFTCSGGGDVIADPSVVGTITGCPHAP